MLDKPYARIGSHPASDLALTEASLPGRWIYLHATQLGIYCVELFHRATDESPINRWLKPGEFISFDRYRVSAELLDNAQIARQPEGNLDQRLSDLGACPRVEIWSEGEMIDFVHLQQELTVIGRGFPSHLQIADRMISAAHCACYWHGGAIWVVDLLSSNGTWKRGRRFQAAVLRQGKSINMGRVELTFTDCESFPPTNVLDHDICLDLTRQLELSDRDLEWNDTLAFGEGSTSLELDDVALSEPPQKRDRIRVASCQAARKDELSIALVEQQDASPDWLAPRRATSVASVQALQLKSPVPSQREDVATNERPLQRSERANTTEPSVEWKAQIAEVAVAQLVPKTEMEKCAEELADEQETVRSAQLTRRIDRDPLRSSREEWEGRLKQTESLLADRARQLDEKDAQLAADQRRLREWQAELEAKLTEQERERSAREAELSRAEGRLREEQEKLHLQLEASRSEWEQRTACKAEESRLADQSRHSKLEEWRAEFERERNEWINQRQEQDRDLKEQALRQMRREAEVEARSCEVERQIVAWRHERDQWEADRATRQQRLDQEAKELTEQQEAFHAQLAASSATQGTKKTPPAERTHELVQRPAELVARHQMLEPDQEEPTPGIDDVLQPISASKKRNNHASEDGSIDQNAAPDREPSDGMCVEMTDRLIKLNGRKKTRFPFWNRP